MPPQGVVGRRPLPFRCWAPSGEGLSVLGLSLNLVPSRARGGHLLAPLPPSARRHPRGAGRDGTGRGCSRGTGPLRPAGNAAWAGRGWSVEGPWAAPRRGGLGAWGVGRGGEVDTRLDPGLPGVSGGPRTAA